MGLLYGGGLLYLGLTSSGTCPASGCPVVQDFAIEIVLPLSITILSVIGLAFSFLKPTAQSVTAT